MSKPAPAMDIKAAAMAVVVKALADPTRLQIVEAIRTSAERPVRQSDLLPLFDMSQPGLAKHLKILVEAGVLVSRRDGLWVSYELVPGFAEELRVWLAAF